MELQKNISKMIDETRLSNDGLIPDIDKNYACETCGNIEGFCHPATSLCFICGADDWLPMEEYLSKKSHP